MHQFLIHFLAIFGTLLSITRVIPTALKLRRTGNFEGVSGASLAIFVISGVWWVSYSVDLHNIPSLISSGAGLCVSIASLYMLFRMGGLNLWIALGTVAMIVLSLLLHGDTQLMGAMAAFSAAVITVPQVVKALRSPESMHGVSVLSWLLVGLNAGVWLAYGLLIGHPLLGAAGIITIPGSLIITWKARGSGSGAMAEAIA